MPNESEIQVVHSGNTRLASPHANDWEVMSETFETLGKVGLAMTVGFAVSAAFCKLVDSGRIKMPNVATLIHEMSQPDDRK